MFIRVTQENAAEFGDVLDSVYVRRCEETGVPVDPVRRERERAKVFRALVYLVVVCRPLVDAPIPVHEQFAAVAAATQNLLLAATELGFGSKWVPGPAATGPVVKQALHLGDSDGFVHLGTVSPQARQKTRHAKRPPAPVRIWGVDTPHVPESLPLA